MDQGSTKAVDLERGRTLSVPEIGTISELQSRLFPNQYEAISFIRKYFSRRDAEPYSGLIRMPTGSGKTGITAVLANMVPEIQNTLVVVPSKSLVQQMLIDLSRKFWQFDVQAQPLGGPKKIHRLFPSTGVECQEFLEDNKLKGAIVVTTPETLETLFRHFWLSQLSKTFEKERILQLSRKEPKVEYAESYRSLKERIDLVVFDEGHREPARIWAKAVRMLHTPIVLMSATPYRNDLRLFNVGPIAERETYRMELRYHEALDDNLIRNVKFIESASDWKDDPQVFVRVITDEYKRLRNELISSGIVNPKIIVRCGSYDSVRRLHRAFVTRELAMTEMDPLYEPIRVIAIHSRFSGGRRGADSAELSEPVKATIAETQFSQPPQRGEDSASIWIHENMLAEGIDIKDFAVLAFYEEFQNSRSLVQQIGRIIRNSRPQQLEQTAYVICNAGSEIQSQWEAYEKFEEYEDSVIGARDIVHRFQAALPDWYYGGRRYRQPTDLESSEEVSTDIRLKRSANVYRIPRDLREEPALSVFLDELAEELNGELEDKDTVELTSPRSRRIGPNGRVMMHIQVTQSPYLSEGGYFDIKLLPSIMLKHGNLLFYKGKVGAKGAKFGRMLIPVEADKLQSLLEIDEPIRQISLINGDLGNNAVRRKLVGAIDLSNTAPGLDDHFHFLSSAMGSFTEDGRSRRRYIGFSRNTITEYADELLTLEEYKNWIGEIASKLLAEEKAGKGLFNRFAPFTIPGAAEDLVPAHLLIELIDFLSAFKVDPDEALRDSFADEFVSTACEVEECIDGPGDYCWDADIDSEHVRGKIRFDAKRMRFVLTSEDLDGKFQRRTADKGRERDAGSEVQSEGNIKLASSFLSSRASIRVVTKSGLLYADGRFYDPRVPLWGKGRIEDIGLIHGLSELGDPAYVTTDAGEKGEPQKIDPENSTWQAGSLFRFIDTDEALYESAGWNRSSLVLVCDDLGAETADFIAVDKRTPRIALIHAKCNDRASFSATRFKEVSSQAIKNLGLFNPFVTYSPDLIGKWKRNWGYDKKDKSKVRTGLNRIRGNSGLSAEEAFDLFQTLLLSATTEKEVWIVYGYGFSVNHLQETLRKTEEDGSLPPYHIVQLLYLMHSCNHAVGSLRAKLRIFSME